MSRIGKQPIAIPPKVKVEVKGQKVLVEGPKGKLDWELPRRTSLKVADGKIVVSREGEDSQAKALHGLSRALVNNMVTGVSTGFTRTLEINGVGYRAAVQGRVLNLQLGYSHDIPYPIPSDIQIACERPTLIAVSGADRQRVGQIAAEIRSYRPPEPYKGKGIKYADETIRRKEGKKK